MRIKNKKSFFMVLGTIVRIILMLLVIFLIIVPAYNKVRKSITDKDYLGSFNGFVDFVNLELGAGERDSYELEIQSKRAVVGFSEGADKFECFNCWDRTKKLVYDKPDVEECQDSACLCLCRDEFEFTEINDVKFGTCDYTCKSLEQDIPTQTRTSDGITNIIWSNGVLFGSLLPLSNGIDSKITLTNRVFVDKTQDTITICNDQMLEHNKGLGIDVCTNPQPIISAEDLENAEATQKIFLIDTFNGFVNIIDQIEENEVDPNRICHKMLDLFNFNPDEVITFDKNAQGKGVVSLKKIEGGNLVDLSPPREIGRVIPYVGIANSPGIINDVLSDKFFQSEIDNFDKYLLRLNAELEITSSYAIKSFESSIRQKAILIQGHGNWILTSFDEVDKTLSIGSNVFERELGGLCW